MWIEDYSEGGGGGSAPALLRWKKVLKQNIFEQAFTWYLIRRFIPNTTRNIQVIVKYV